MNELVYLLVVLLPFLLALAYMLGRWLAVARLANRRIRDQADVPAEPQL